jgi:hypothetical protein
MNTQTIPVNQGIHELILMHIDMVKTAVLLAKGLESPVDSPERIVAEKVTELLGGPDLERREKWAWAIRDTASDIVSNEADRVQEGMRQLETVAQSVKRLEEKDYAFLSYLVQRADSEFRLKRLHEEFPHLGKEGI